MGRRPVTAPCLRTLDTSVLIQGLVTSLDRTARQIYNDPLIVSTATGRDLFIYFIRPWANVKEFTNCITNLKVDIYDVDTVSVSFNLSFPLDKNVAISIMNCVEYLRLKAF